MLIFPSSICPTSVSDLVLWLVSLRAYAGENAASQSVSTAAMMDLERKGVAPRQVNPLDHS